MGGAKRKDGNELPRRTPTKSPSEGLEIRSLLKLFDALLAGRTLDVEEIVRTKCVSPGHARKIYGYIHEELSGIQETKEGLRLPSVLVTKRFTEEEVVGTAVMSGIARMFEGSKYAAGVQSIVQFVADHAARTTHTDDFDRKFIFATRGGDPAVPNRRKWLELVVDAILQQKNLDIDWVSFNRESRQDVVAPLSLLVYDHQLYVIVRTSTGDFEARRFSRLRGVEPTSKRFEYPTPAEFDPRRLLDEVWGVFLNYEKLPEEVEVRFAPSWGTYVRNHKWHVSQNVLDPDRLVVRFTVRPCPEFARWLRSFGADIEVLKPAWLREQIHRDHVAAAEVYATTSTDAGAPAAETTRKPAGRKKA